MPEVVQSDADRIAAMFSNRMRASVAILAAATLALSGCTSIAPERTVRDENFQAPPQPPQFYPEGTAEQNLPYFTEVMRVFSVGGEPVEGVSVVNAVAGAGFDKAVMQVSHDRSKTDLVADHIMVSVLMGSDCLLGQVITADRTFFTAVERAVGPEQNICLIGNTRVIDW